MVQITLPASLRRFVDGRERVTVEGCDIRSAIEQLDAAHPGVKAKLCDGHGNH